MIIDLKKLVGENIMVLAGMERGIAARADFGLDSLDDTDDDVIIKAPNSLEAIAPSFVQGFLSSSFIKLGEIGLKAKYRLPDREDLAEDLREGVKRLKMERKIAGHSGG